MGANMSLLPAAPNGGGAGLGDDSMEALVSALQRQQQSVLGFLRRSLGASFHMWLRFWISLTGLERHEALLRRLWQQYKYRLYASPDRGPAAAYHGMAVTVVELWLRTLRVVLVPDVFARYLCASFLLHIFYEMNSRARKWLGTACLQLTSRGRKRLRLSRLLEQAKTFQERQAIAGELDKIEGKDKWRENPESSLYLYERVINKTQMYKRLQLENDVMGLMFALRAGLLRKHWGLGNPRLYSVSHAHGFFHSGVIKALNENNLLPNVIAGSSAGSIVAGIVGVRTDDEIAEFFTDPDLDLTFLGANITPKDYEAFSPSFLPVLEAILPRAAYEGARDMLVMARRFIAKGYVLDGNVLRDGLRRHIGNYTFREAYDRTGRIINITVTPLKTDDYPHLLNYLTAPNVLIWSASLASCAIPKVFPSVELLAKDKHGNIVPYYREGLKWSDGSIECDLPMERLSELFNVNHFIVSQVNIHYKVVSGHTAFGFGQTGSLLSFLKKQMKAYIKNIAEFGLNTSVLKFLDIGLIPLLTQKYEGDITICPTETYPMLYLLRTVLTNPTMETFDGILKAGERACWPHISRVRTMCRIEFALERAVRYLRGEQALEDERRHGKKAIGRVPSFYTSPSSMNLSSLDQAATPRSNPSPSSSSSNLRRRFGSEDITESSSSSSQPLRRNKSVNVAGAVMTMELAANTQPHFGRFADDGS
ncbi:hypothetical protein P43SY_009535 [Pythium insidiosum]|uniref:PNPLA domain-containing protein n=1 Tax=Pythium insidiosum TaxID=114742 RepID=A0AAD5LD82_PYTIN|nr:hypothetical protein P43SY_009535 [Pythium insidiosum]